MNDAFMRMYTNTSYADVVTIHPQLNGLRHIAYRTQCKAARRFAARMTGLPKRSGFWVQAQCSNRRGGLGERCHHREECGQSQQAGREQRCRAPQCSW